MSTYSGEGFLWRFAHHAAVLEVAVRFDGGERVADDEHSFALELLEDVRPVRHRQVVEGGVEREVVRLLEQSAAAIRRQLVRTVG